MNAPGPVTVLLDSPGWQVFAQAWPTRDGDPRWAWGVASRAWPGFLVEGGLSGLAYFDAPRARRPWFLTPPAQPARQETDAQAARLTWPANRHGLVLTWEARLSPHGPLLWRLAVENRGPAPVWLHRWTLLRVGPRAPLRRGVFGRIAGAVAHFGRRTAAPPMEHPGALRITARPGPLAFYAHAWASWGSTRVYFDQPARPQARFLIDALLPPRHDPAAPKPRGPNHFYADLLGMMAQRQARRGLLLGFAGQRQFFGGLEVRLHRLEPFAHLQAFGDRVPLEPGARAATDWAVLWLFDLDDPDGLQPYLQATAQVLGVEPPADDPPTGWLSWYAYFREVTAEQVQANARAVAELAAQGLPLDIVQIDDGYAAVPGQWETHPRNGFGNLAQLATDIHTRGLQAGIWQAPFIAHRAAAATLRKLLRWARWGPAFAGWVWNTLTFGLDASHPEAQARAERMAQSAAQMGFDYLKLDFLYAAALPGRRFRPQQSRAAALYQALARTVQAFRRAAGPQARVLLCGVPLGTAIGLADTVRIGPDVDPHWRMPHPLPWVRRHPDVPGLGNALRGALMRAWMHRGWWLNDPDALVPTSPHLTPAEQETWLTVVALLGGAWFLSAHLPALEPAMRQRLLRVFPPVAGRAWVPDLWDAYPPRRLRVDLAGPGGAWQVVAAINWADRPVTVQLRAADFGPPGLPEHEAFWLRPFWSDQPPRLLPADAGWEATLPAHGVGVWALRPAGPGPHYAGSDLHVSQGQEVRAWQATDREVRFTLALPGPRQGQVWLALPFVPRQAWVADRPAACTPVPQEPPPGPWRLYRLPVAWEGDAVQVVVTA